MSNDRKEEVFANGLNPSSSIVSIKLIKSMTGLRKSTRTRDTTNTSYDFERRADGNWV